MSNAGGERLKLAATALASTGLPTGDPPPVDTQLGSCGSRASGLAERRRLHRNRTGVWIMDAGHVVIVVLQAVTLAAVALPYWRR